MDDKVERPGVEMDPQKETLRKEFLTFRESNLSFFQQVPPEYQNKGLFGEANPFPPIANLKHINGTDTYFLNAAKTKHLDMSRIEDMDDSNDPLGKYQQLTDEYLRLLSEVNLAEYVTVIEGNRETVNSNISRPLWHVVFHDLIHTGRNAAMIDVIEHDRGEQVFLDRRARWIPQKPAHREPITQAVAQATPEDYERVLDQDKFVLKMLSTDLRLLEVSFADLFEDFDSAACIQRGLATPHNLLRNFVNAAKNYSAWIRGETPELQYKTHHEDLPDDLQGLLTELSTTIKAVSKSDETRLNKLWGLDYLSVHMAGYLFAIYDVVGKQKPEEVVKHWGP